jgi:hypothetical protein
MTELVLKKIGKPFGAAPWLEKEDDFLCSTIVVASSAGL